MVDIPVYAARKSKAPAPRSPCASAARWPTPQFGMTQGYAGSTRRGSSIPWGDIPGRPFLGISDSDSASILDIIVDHLAGGF